MTRVHIFSLLLSFTFDPHRTQVCFKIYLHNPIVCRQVRPNILLKTTYCLYVSSSLFLLICPTRNILTLLFRPQHWYYFVDPNMLIEKSRISKVSGFFLPLQRSQFDRELTNHSLNSLQFSFLTFTYDLSLQEEKGSGVLQQDFSL